MTSDMTGAGEATTSSADLDFRCAVNAELKATELPFHRICGTARQNPHMRAFWLATSSFFLSFVGWFAFAPLNVDVAYSMGICENQLFPPAEHKARKAYLKFKNIKTGAAYCQYGANSPSAPTDCRPVPGDVATVHNCSAVLGAQSPKECNVYQPSVLAQCVCTGGTECSNVLADAGIASVASTIGVRVALGTLLERFGPVNTQTVLLVFGAVVVALGAAVTAPWNFIVIRGLIGLIGGSFVVNQFWCSFMFAPNIVGTVNATSAGWGNLGGGVTQFFMVLCLFQPFQDAGLSKDMAWRMSLLVPAGLLLLTAVATKMLGWDTPTKRRLAVSDTGKAKAASWRDYWLVLKDVRVVVMVFHYAACFGTELAMNNQLASHFQTYFQMKASEAALLASAFGGMNLFARSLGGIASDVMFAYLGFPGRIWAHFLSLLLEAVFLFAFGCISNEQPWYVALALLVPFSLFVQMAEGTTFGIVPFMNKQQLAVISALVGAGGNLGAVIASFGFYKPIADPLVALKAHAGFVLFWTLLTPVFYWPEHGGMFSGPKQEASEKVPGHAAAEQVTMEVPGKA